MARPKKSSQNLVVRTQVKEFLIPPVRDGLVLGKRSPIGCIAFRKALQLLTSSDFEHIEFNKDNVISDIIVRKSILNRLPKQKLVQFVKKNIKPLMDDKEILHLELEVIVNLEEQL